MLLSNKLKVVLQKIGLCRVVVVQNTTVQYTDLLKNKRILITGGSSGIGFEIASKFLNLGAKVLITGRNEEKLIQAQNNLNNDSLYILKWDLTKFNEYSAFLNTAVEMLEGIDVLINNAGIGINKSYLEMTESDWDQTIDTNLKSVYFLSQKVIKYYLEPSNQNNITRKIINIGSMQGFISGLNPYNISKFGLNSLTQGLAKEYTKYNIIVNSIAPGYVATPMNNVDVEVNAYLKSTLNKRIGTTQEIAELAVYLTSDSSNNIIGQTILIDGGESIK